MPNTLKAISALAGAKKEFDGIAISEINGRSMVSIAVAKGKASALKSAVKKGYGLTIPNPGQSKTSKTDNAVLAWMTPDQFFLIFDEKGTDPTGEVRKKLGNVGYLTDQSDSWTSIAVSGPRCRVALERICPIDISKGAFPIGSIARTTMEHLGAIIMRTDTDSFVLMSSRSSAGSFFHAIEKSAQNVS